MDPKSFIAKALLFVFAAFSPAVAAAAAAWPEKPIRIIIPWPPGGSTDIVARLLGAELTKRLGQQVIIDNRSGAASIIGLQLAAQTPPDGYNWMITSTAYGHLIYKSRARGVDYVKSFAPVALLGLGDAALVVHPSLPVKTVKDLIALAKARPGQLTYSSSGWGGFPHMNTELFKLRAKVDMLHVPFQGGGPAIADTVAGNTQVHLGSLVTEMPHIRSGRLKVIATGAKKRNPALPGIPTISESGVPGYESYIWWGMFAPLKTPQDIITRMNAEVNAVMETPDMVKKLEAQGGAPAKMSPAEFGKFMVAETDKWLEVIRLAGIRQE